MREMCAREGIDWPDFVKNGITADALRAMNNAMAERVIAHAERLSNGQR
jgi:hypothetical protein